MSYSKTKDLRSLFLENNKQAMSGKRIIDRYLRQNRNLSHLLRHHNELGIDNDETWLRDDVDYFLEYFSILSLGHITGYLTLNDLNENRDEIYYYLSLIPVKNYYYRHYPLELPQILLEVIEQNRPFTNQSRRFQKSELLFHQFHGLNQKIDNEDVNQFLWFLDGGSNDDYDIDDFKKTVRNTDRCFEIRAQTRNNALRQSVRGFFMYLDFLQQFDWFLKTPTDRLVKSAYWMYHAYWFRKINKRLQSSIRIFFDGLSNYVAKTEQKSTLINRVKVSEKLYMAIFERTIFTDKYNKFFSTYMKNWRGDNFKDQNYRSGRRG